MKIALIGYGRMGHEIEKVALERRHSINLIIDKDNLSDFTEEKLLKSDVAIEFTTPATAFGNVARCLKMKIPVVCGTTGWQDDYDRAAELCLQNDVSFIHSTNFSIGVNILFRLNSELARCLSGYPGYKPFIEEIHHTKKLDSPSGTAITLAGGISDQHASYEGWIPEGEKGEKVIPIRSVREGMVPGTHTISWDSEVDTISLKHEAKGRMGLALGAVVAAEFISGRKGVFTMEDVLRF
ncbi:MAG: 4-hydroxy-tetrahydrodipicolinate reductase [Bacteroidales bacterium]|jgi:4-hydroxy-tetrahydrodipicolinate reductase|nr:4-hydroxy-tetrahydrodipicolinate reductase [Bacteroidales bacterium]